MTPSSRVPSVAVIVPNWNDSKYLRRCITSILEQEVPPDELILVDDKSTDDSVAVMRSLIANTDRAKLIENPVNLGVYGAVDEGLKHCRSEYILFLSANDFVLPGIFARAKACIANNPGVGIWSAMGWHVDEAGLPIRVHPAPVISWRDACFTPQQCVQLAWRYGNWFTGTTLIYRREALDAMGGFDPANKGLADLIAALTIASRQGAAYSPVPYAVVRLHENSYISGTWGNEALIESILDRLREHGPVLGPGLFTRAFLDRIALRFRGATVRVTRGKSIADVAGRYTGWRRLALVWIDRMVPARLWQVRVALAFMVLRPFDIVPMVWARIAGRMIVALRSRHSGRDLRNASR